MNIFVVTFTNYETKLIKLLDEYERRVGFYCESKDWHVHSLVDAKSFCSSDRTCIGFLSNGVHDNVFRMCANSSRMISRKVGRFIMNIKTNNGGMY